MDQFMPGASHNERLQVLQNTAEKVRNETYAKPLTPDELAEKKDEFFSNAKKLNELEGKRKEAMDSFKREIKPLEDVHYALLEQVTYGQIKVTGNLYDLIDYDSNIVNTYDENGDFVASRRALPQEIRGQSKLFLPTDYKRAASNDM